MWRMTVVDQAEASDLGRNLRFRQETLVLGKSSIREIPRVGSGRSSPGPGTV
jgi:hypothetical protein